MNIGLSLRHSSAGPRPAPANTYSSFMKHRPFENWLFRLALAACALQALPSSAQRIGVTGISMGATRTWWIMALDERPRTGVAVACLTRYRNLIDHGGLKYHGIYYYVPGLLNHFDTEAVVALVAPRPLLFMTGDQDGGSPVDGIHSIEKTVRPFYGLYGRESDFVSVIYPGVGHTYLPEEWEKTQQWMDGHLK